MRGVSFLRGYAMNKILGLIAAALLFSVVGIGVAAPELPGDIEWLTNDSDPLYSSPEAKKGGTFRASLQSFPLTLRLVGPDSNNAFAGVMRSLQFSLIETHPNTENIIP